MAKAIDTLSIRLEFKDAGAQQVVDKIKGSFRGLQQVISGNTTPAMRQLRNEINTFAVKGNKSISTIEGQVTALRALRREADINSKEFKELTADIAKYEKQLNKAHGRKGGGGGARQATQVAGAVISGGIFGGPEGAIGGALGAFGGVQGAFAGAAIGAQVGGLRKSVAAAADYAAEIGKLKIALEGVSKVENDQLNLTERAALSQQNYNSALETAAEATRELNVPQDAAVRGITRLTAAVTGAGGPIGDAETTFKNVTAAIKATGGSTEDVKGAITAMVQVFSKGKVSAEELSGQLGERLPGAVTMFAKANRMTLPELQKNLKAGTVGLNELMRFVEELGTTFDGTAKKIAGSNEEAGARLSVAIREMQAEIGTALIPIGAQFQDAFGEFIQTITPFLKQALPAIGNLLLGVSKNLDTLAVAAAAAIAALSVIKILAIVTAIKSLSVAKIALLRNVVRLKKGLAALNIVALANPYVLLAAGAAALAAKIYAAGKEQARLNLLIKEGSSASVKTELDALHLEKVGLEPTAYSGKTVTRQGKIRDTTAVAAAKARIAEIKKTETKLRARLPAALNDETQGAGIDMSSFQPFDYPTPTTESGDDDGGGKDAKSTLARRIEQAQKLEMLMQRRLNLAQAENPLARLLAQQANQRAAIEQKIAKIKEGGTSKEIETATAAARSLQAQEQAARLQERVKQLSEKALKPLQDAVQAVKDQGEAKKRIEELIKEGINPERAKDIANLEKLKEKSIEVLNVDIEILKLRIARGDAAKAEKEALDELIKKRQEAEGVDPKEATSDGGYEEKESEFKQFQDTFTKGLEDMMNVGPKLAGVAVGAIGTMTDGLIELITTGKADFKAMAASILKDIAKIMIQAAIAGAVKKMFGLADGGVIQGGRIKPYAKGGVVAGPTMFPMAGGDIGLMGEAGPEAVMPLKRGANGRLGVEVANQVDPRAAMSRYSRGSRGNSVIPASGGGGDASGGGTATLAPIDVRYSVERINSVDYVTADQFQAGMREAASSGAKQGEQRALTTLRQNTTQRRRIGI